MSRFDRTPFAEILEYDYATRTSLAANPKEEFLWKRSRTSALVWTLLFSVIILAPLLYSLWFQVSDISLLFIGSGVAAAVLLGLALALIAGARAIRLQKARGDQSVSSFLTAIGFEDEREQELALKIREVLARMYDARSESVRADDTPRVLSKVFIHRPLTFECVVGAMRNAGRELPEETVDRLIARMGCECRDVRDIVRLLVKELQ